MTQVFGQKYSFHAFYLLQTFLFKKLIIYQMLGARDMSRYFLSPQINLLDTTHIRQLT